MSKTINFLQKPIDPGFVDTVMALAVNHSFSWDRDLATLTAQVIAGVNDFPKAEGVIPVAWITRLMNIVNEKKDNMQQLAACIKAAQEDYMGCSIENAIAAMQQDDNSVSYFNTVEGASE